MLDHSKRNNSTDCFQVDSKRVKRVDESRFVVIFCQFVKLVRQGSVELIKIIIFRKSVISLLEKHIEVKFHLPD